MAFGICGRNKSDAYEGANQESRNYCRDVCAKRLASLRDGLQFPLRQRTLQPILEVDPARRWSQLHLGGRS
jgi:hypothetical protein